MPWGHSAVLRVRHVCIALLFAYDTEQTAAAFPLRQFHTPLEIHIRAFTAQRPVSGMDDLTPRHPPPPQAPADYAGLDFSAAAALRPPPQCRAVIARSVGDPFASDDPQPRQRLLRTRAPAEASLLRIDAVVLCIATSAANLRPLPSAATHHPDGLPGQGKAQASAFQPGHCSLVERRLIPLRDPGVHWGLCNASAPKATYGIDPETPQCPRLRDLHRPAADMPTGAAACQIGLRPI